MSKTKVKVAKKEVSLTLGQKIGKVLFGYFTTQFILMVLVGFASWGVLSLLHVKYAVLLGILTGILSGIPNFGIFIATVAVTLTAFFDKVNMWPGSSPWLEALVVLVIFVVLNKIVDLLIAPLFLGMTNKVNPLVVLSVVVLGTITFGVWGAILAVPIYLVIKTVVEHFLEK